MKKIVSYCKPCPHFEKCNGCMIKRLESLNSLHKSEPAGLALQPWHVAEEEPLRGHNRILCLRAGKSEHGRGRLTTKIPS